MFNVIVLRNTVENISAADKEWSRIRPFPKMINQGGVSSLNVDSTIHWAEGLNGIKKKEGLGSVIKYLPRMHETLGLIPNIDKKDKVDEALWHLSILSFSASPCTISPFSPLSLTTMI